MTSGSFEKVLFFLVLVLAYYPLPLVFKHVWFAPLHNLQFFQIVPLTFRFDIQNTRYCSRVFTDVISTFSSTILSLLSPPPPQRGSRVCTDLSFTFTQPTITSFYYSVASTVTDFTGVISTITQPTVPFIIQ